MGPSQPSDRIDTSRVLKQASSVEVPLGRIASAASARVVNLTGVSSKAIAVQFDFSQARRLLAAQLKDFFDSVNDAVAAKMPPNWPNHVDWEDVLLAIKESGIALVWVPRAAIVQEVIDSANAGRDSVLLAHTLEIAEDCHHCLADISAPDLQDQVTLAFAAVDAFKAGHYEAAQALAVVVTETSVAANVSANYKDVKKTVALQDPGELTVADLRLRAALAPIDPFYTSWYPNSGTPAPTNLSRHVSVHQADPHHYTPANAHRSLLLAASVLSAIAEWKSM